MPALANPSHEWRSARMAISTRCLGFVPATLMVAAVTIGCGGEPEFAPQPTPPDAGTDAPSTQPPLPDASAPDASAPTTSQPCDATMSLALSSMFEGRRKTEAPGMDIE